MSGAYEEVFYGEQRTQEGNIRIHVHVDGFHESPRGFFMTPMMRSRKELVYVKGSFQALAKIAERLDVVIYLIDISLAVTEIDVRQNKFAIWF